jgi:hypothetical protein
MRFRQGALGALQEAAEAYLVGLLEGKDSDYYNDYY